ncbi:MAG: PspC domain-containing protein [Bacteroidetes bacterium]|nr:PspC domain-containing protein [Bacteroidota bacterium]
MNKTVTVNIGGMVFHIEESAYESLGKYLNAIRGHFTSSDGREEIMQDIESRIAEMLQQRIGTTRQVVELHDVEEVITVMGKPEMFEGTTDSDIKKEDTAYDMPLNGARKMYRDEDEKVIAGVCAGLSYRLGIDPAWLRVAFVLLFLFGTGGFWIYLILWIVLPKAVTTAQKLEMRGKPVNVESIKKNFNSYQTEQTGIQRFFETLGEIIKIGFKIFAYIAAVFFGIIGVIVLIALVVGLFGILGVTGISMPVFMTNMFISQSQQFWVIAATLLLIGVPVLYILYKIFKWIFKVKTSYPWVRASALFLMLMGVAIAFYCAFDIGQEMAYEGGNRTSVNIAQPMRDTVGIALLPQDESMNMIRNNFSVGFNSKRWSVRNGDKIFNLEDNVQLNIERSMDDKFELVQVSKAKGRSEEDAMQNANAIIYRMEQRDNKFFFGSRLQIDQKRKFRFQRVRLVLRVPVGKVIYLEPGSEDVFYDLKNVTNTWDNDMVGHYWLMTDKGLKCLDYDFKKEGSESESYNENDDWNSDTTRSTLNINGKDAKVEINKNGVTITTDNDTISINSNSSK